MKRWRAAISGIAKPPPTPHPGETNGESQIWHNTKVEGPASTSYLLSTQLKAKNGNETNDNLPLWS